VEIGAIQIAENQMDHDALLAEYHALRAEILNRQGIQHQILSLAILAIGTLITVGIQSHQAALALLYPFFAFFLASAWRAQDRGISQIGEYIRVRIENALPSMGWEGFMAKARKKRIIESFTFFAARGVFLGTEILAVVVGLVLTSPLKDPLLTISNIQIPDFGNAVDALFVLAIITTCLTAAILARNPVVQVPPYLKQTAAPPATQD
jgi:hypothetical protein